MTKTKITKINDAADAAHNTPVGRKEIAALLGVDPGTVTKWQERGIMPPPVEGWAVGGHPVWRKLVVLVWAFQTLRLPTSATYPKGVLHGLDLQCERCESGTGKHAPKCSSPPIMQAVADSLTGTKRVG